MSPLQQLLRLEEFLGFLGDHPVPADKILTMLQPAVRKLNKDGGSGPDQERVSHTKAKELTGRSDSWFRAPLKILGGKSRLEAWSEGHAGQEGRQWFICMLVLQPEIARHAANSGRRQINDMSKDAGAGATDVDSLQNALNQFLNVV